MRRSLGKMSKRSRSLGRQAKRLTIPRLVRTYAIGDKVVVTPQSKYQGMPHPRYRGKHGEVKAQRGKAYVVEIKDHTRKKELIVPPVHLERA